MNNLPRVDDKTNAFFRRLIILRFPREFSESEQNKNLIDELLPELNGIFLWYLDGLKRLRSRGYFEIPVQVRREIEEYRQENNNVMIFVEEKCLLGNEYSINKTSLYFVYSNFCKDNNYRPVSIKRFGKELKRQFNCIHDGRSSNERFWKGIDTDITR
jgi:putative DNA primase/helicase